MCKLAEMCIIIWVETRPLMNIIVWYGNFCGFISFSRRKKKIHINIFTRIYFATVKRGSKYMDHWDLKLYPSHLALGILCIHLYLLCQSTCNRKKNPNLNLKKTQIMQVRDTLTLLKSSWLPSCQNWSSKFKIKNIDHRRKASSCSENLQTLIYKLVIPNLICTLGQLVCLIMYWLGFAI